MKKLIFILFLISIIQFNKENQYYIPCEKMYSSIIHYADSFNIPRSFAFNIALLETGYRGPFDSTYNHKQVSKSGAFGPMQISHRFSKIWAGREISKEELRDNIDLNIKLSMFIISENFKKYKSWPKAAAVYNTGSPKINNYAKMASDPNYFRSKWISDSSIVE